MKEQSRKKRKAPAKKSVDPVEPQFDKNVSPVGWYIATYVLRFVEMNSKHIHKPEARFTTWENTILVKATSLDHAYDKTVAIGKSETEPYKGGKDAIDVQWLFEGVTELLPIYEDLEDGNEIMWAERNGRKLKSIRASIRKKDEFRQ